MSTVPIVEDPFEIFKYVKAILGYPVVEVEITDEQLNLFLKNSLETYSRVIPQIKWYSIAAFPGQQEYVLDKGDMGNGIVDVMIPRIDPIAPLMLCLDGETKITLLDGRSRTILELQEEYGSGEFWVYSAAPDGSIHPGRAHSIRQTGADAETVEVEISNGEKVYCTPEHRWMLRDGSYREAKDLQPGDSLMPLYRQHSSLNAPKYEKALSVMGDLSGANHTVVAVRTDIKRNVYDLTVDNYHNFALDCGVFVHNSSGPRLDIFGYRYSYPYRDISELYIDYMYFTEATKILSSDFQWDFRDGKLYITPKPDEPFSMSFAAAHPRDMASIPASDIDWIRMHVLAQAEIAVGRVRRKYRIPGSHSEQILDGPQLVVEGSQRLAMMEAELMKRTPDFGPMRTN